MPPRFSYRVLGAAVDIANLAEVRESRREFERVQLDASVELLHPASASGIAINVSAGGMRIAVDRPIAVGRMCVAVVHTGQREVVEYTRVIWSHEKSDGWVLGLQFVEPGVN